MKRISIPPSNDNDCVKYNNYNNTNNSPINYSSNTSLFSFFNTELNEIEELFKEELFNKISLALSNDSSISGGEST